MIREFRLAPIGSGLGVSCDANGAFIGAIPLLRRSNAQGEDRWEPRSCGELSKQIGEHFGLPIDISSKAGGLRAISNALNDDDIARAQIATVQLAIPDPPPLLKDDRPREAMIRFIRDLNWSGLIKADWESDKHPRWPTGAPDSQGGRFAPKGFLQTLVDDISQDAEALLSEAGRAEIDRSKAEYAGAAAIANAANRTLHDFDSYIAKPWNGADGRPVQIPIIETGDPNSDAGYVVAHAILEPDAPLARPGTNADRIMAFVGLASAGATAAHLAFGPAGAETPAAPEPAPPAVPKPFITLRAKLPADFGETVPIGKFEFPDDLTPGTKGHGDYAHGQIGKLLQEAAGTDVDLILNTAPNMRGVDVQVPSPKIEDVGFEFAEIKPLSRSGRSRFNHQVLNIWDLEGRVQPITYDKNGNIFYGFPGL